MPIVEIQFLRVAFNLNVGARAFQETSRQSKHKEGNSSSSISTETETNETNRKKKKD